jgi:hypothetical protein
MALEIADAEIVQALGTVTLHACHAEGGAARVLGLLVSPHPSIGDAIAAGASMGWMIERIRVLAALRLEPSELLDLIEDWADEAAACNDLRNALIHGEAIAAYPTTPGTQDRGEQLHHTFADRTVDELHSLAERLSAVAAEAPHLVHDLVQAGLGEATRVTPAGTTPLPPSTLLKVTPPPLSGRPDGFVGVPRRR